MLTAVSTATVAAIFLADTGSAFGSAYWNATSSSWQTGANWSNATSGGSTGALPSASNAAVLNQASNNSNEVITLNNDATVSGITINNTSTTALTSDSSTARTLTVNAGGIVIASTAGSVTLGDATNTLIVSGSGVITKSGSSVLTLIGANNYSGGTTINAGTLNINNAGSGGTSSAIGTGTLSLGNSSASVVIDNTTANAITLSTNNAILAAGGLTFGGTKNLTFGTGGVSVNSAPIFTLNGSGSSLTFGGTVTTTSTSGNLTLAVNGAGNTVTFGGWNISSGGGTASNLSISGTGNVTIAGVVANNNTNVTPASALTYNGTGTFTLSGANTYTGKTTVGNGTVQFAKLGSLYSGVSSNWTPTSINVVSGATLALNVGGTNEFAATDVNALLSSISVAGSSSSTGLQAGAKIGFDTTNASGGIFTQGNVIANSTGTKGGAIGVTKLGTNTLVLDKDNTYTGDTKIALGTLRLGAANRIANASAMELAGGTFDTAGFSETVGALKLSGNANIDLGSGASVLHYAASQAIGWTSGTVLSILDWSGSSTDQLFFGSSTSGLTAGQLAQIQFINPGTSVGTYGAQILSTGEVVAAVPEPAALGAISIGAISLLRRRKRHR